MSKSITFSYKDKEYTLEFDKVTASRLETTLMSRGVTLSDAGDAPATVIPLAFREAFRKKHPTISEDLVTEIYNHITHKQELIGVIAELYRDTIDGIFAEPEEDGKNISWTQSW